MKIAEKIRKSRLFSSPGQKTNKRGIALVTVLTIMSLTTILVLTFFSLANSERQASNTYSHGLQAQQVAEQAVNMVIGQMRKATTRDTAQGSAWASQPGAIRVWNTNGEMLGAYKLYSDETMLTQDEDFSVTDFSDLDGWSSDDNADHFVDLNEPVIRGEKVYYPIVHPAAADLPEWPKPIGDDQAGVEGFQYNFAGGRQLNDQGNIGAKAAQIAGASGGHVAMPVKWIYQLADGTIGILNGSKQFTPYSGSGKASEKNPIVARFAFWADDETSKLNVNTAAGGLAWDIPKAGGDMDMDMAKYQPAQHEWQRYPGHPASTHLIPALAPGVLDIVNDRDAMELLFLVVPRVVGGGSESGTRLINTFDPKEELGLIADNDPLYPTIDDIIMRSDREPNKFPDARGRPIPEEELAEYLERSKFFITAVSRAPEVNMFNKPRVAIWPIYNADYGSNDYKELKLTPFDRLINYCASMGKQSGGGYPRYEYIFKRENADSTTDDYDKIPRNQDLYKYLTNFLEEPFPGFGDSFSSKYPGQTDQLVTQIFDYIRCTNLHDDSLFDDFDDAFQSGAVSEHRTYTNPRNENNKALVLKGHGQVVPIKIGNTKGFGRFPTLSSVQTQTICCADGSVSGDGRPPVYNSHPGIVDYRGRGVRAASGETYSNFPPIPDGVNPNDTAKHPQWLKELKMNHPDLFQAAFDPSNWNWQLAFLDQQYRDLVLGAGASDKGNPTQNKFQRSSLSLTAFLSGETRLKSNEKLVQSILLFNMYTPSVGWNAINPDMEIKITMEKSNPSEHAFGGTDASGSPVEVDFLINDPSTGHFRGDNSFIWASNAIDTAWSERRYGGQMSFPFSTNCLMFRELRARRGVEQTGNRGGQSRLTPLDRVYNELESLVSTANIPGDSSKIANAYKYDLVTAPYRISDPTGGNNIQLIYGGGQMRFEFFHGGKYAELSAPQQGVGSTGVDGGETIQTIELQIPGYTVPGPNIVPNERRLTGWENEFQVVTGESFGPMERFSLTADPANLTSDLSYSKSIDGETFAVGRLGHQNLHNNPTLFSVGDVIQSVAVRHGDPRVVAVQSDISSTDDYFKPHREYGNSRLAHSLIRGDGGLFPGANVDGDYYLVPNLNYAGSGTPLVFATEKSSDVQRHGDFDNGAGLMIDGAYINKPDEGNVNSLKGKYSKQLADNWEALRHRGAFPYFNQEWRQEAGGPAYFSPNRLVSGPGMFGSMPTQAADDKPWQTLLFRPDVSGNGYDPHPGAQDPPDHLIMDLFWMPVVEPYAISEPLSTAGKVNINYEIAPFRHIERSTAVRGLFRSEFMVCIPNALSRSYKSNHGRGRGYHWRDAPYNGELQGKRLRSVIVEDDTLEQFRTKFDQNDDNIFKSATQICEIHLIGEEVAVRLGINSNKAKIGTYKPSLGDMENGKYWRDHSLVGDNSRERPYTNIQQRITTKSNTFKVHYRAQVLKQSRRATDDDYGKWDPSLDTVQAEYRGSSVVERYVDPDDPEIPDFTNGSNQDLNEFYKYRVVNPRRFAP